VPTITVDERVAVADLGTLARILAATVHGFPGRA
jgi:hypothetical protein